MKRLVVFIETDYAIYNDQHFYYLLLMLRDFYNRGMVLKVPDPLSPRVKMPEKVYRLIEGIMAHPRYPLNQIGERIGIHEALRQFIGKLDYSKRNMIDDVLVMANAALLEDIKKRFVQGKYDGISLMSLSNRQSGQAEKEATRRTATRPACLDLLAFSTKLNAMIGRNVCVYEEMLLGDLCSNLPPGTAKKEIIAQWEYSQTSTYYSLVANVFGVFSGARQEGRVPSQSVRDESRFLICYANLQYLANRYYKSNKDGMDVLCLADDVSLLKLYLAIETHKSILPDRSCVEFAVPCAAEKRESLGSTLPLLSIEKGEVDPCFQSNVRVMATLCGHDLVDYRKTIDASLLDLDDFYRSRLVGTPR